MNDLWIFIVTALLSTGENVALEFVYDTEERCNIERAWAAEAFATGAVGDNTTWTVEEYTISDCVKERDSNE